MTVSDVCRLPEPMKVADNCKASNSSVWQEELASCKIFCLTINSEAVLEDAVRSKGPSILVFRTLQKN